MTTKRLAIIIPWFGEDIKGGAEQHTWDVATHLVQAGVEVDVLTTCCKSFQSDWGENFYPEGETSLYGMTVRRFSVRKQNRIRFDGANRRILSVPKESLRPGISPVSRKCAEDFVKENIHSPSLIRYLKEKEAYYTSLLFVTYFYGTSLAGMGEFKRKAFLLPALHDEWYAYLPQVQEIFHAAKGLLFLSEGEREVAAKLYGPAMYAKGIVAGGGVGMQDVAPLGKTEEEKLRKKTGSCFCLTLGRRDVHKNTLFLLEAYAEYCGKNRETKLKLVFAGPGKMPAGEEREGIVDLGLVSEEEKRWLLQNCRVLLHPSENESYSRVMMEAWLQGRPVAVHRFCLATSRVVAECGGGFTASTKKEWVNLLDEIDHASEERLNLLGKKGKEYVHRFATWEKSIERYQQFLGLTETEKKKTASRQKENRTPIHQLLVNYKEGDAISFQVRKLQEKLRSVGIPSEIYAGNCEGKPSGGGEVHEVSELKAESDAGLLYHYSQGSPLTKVAAQFPGKKVLVYHNITPASFFEPYNPGFARTLEEGRKELAEYAPFFDAGCGDSLYNCKELQQFGYASPFRLPIITDPLRWDQPADEQLLQVLSEGGVNILFVGRIVPQKKVEDVLDFYTSLREFLPSARLFLAGSFNPHDAYYRMLLKKREGSPFKEDIYFTGHIRHEELSAYYRSAHLYCSMSEHEGYGVPLVEAMWHQVPVLAFDAAAVAETLGEGGVLISSKENMQKVAALAALMITDETLRQKIKEAQKNRCNLLAEESEGETYLLPLLRALS